MKMNLLRSSATLLVISTTAVAVLGLASQGRAEVAYTFTGGTPTSGQTGTYGFDFTPRQERIAIDSLGFFDFGMDGIDDHRVGIWNSITGELRASVTVTTANSTLAGPVINGGQFRFTPITPLLASIPGSFICAAAIEGSSDIWYTGATSIESAPNVVDINYLNGQFTTAPFAKPNTFVSNGHFGAASFTAYIVVPEPTTIALCIMVGVTFTLRCFRSRSAT